MAFWNKGQDPWDVDPEKKKTGPSSGEALKDTDWKAAASLAGEKLRSAVAGKKKPDVPEGPPMACPWCGKAMARRYLWGRQVYLGEHRPGFFSSGLSEDNRNILDQGVLIPYKTVWYCRDCEKLAAELPLPPAEAENGPREDAP